MRPGHTLIELIITIVIIAIISATAYLSIGAYESLRVDAAAKRIATDLDYTRNLALSTSKWHHVVFQADPANSYASYLSDNWFDTQVDDPSAPGKPLAVDLDDSYKGVRIVGVNLGFNQDIYFHPLGTPFQDAGMQQLGQPGQIVLQFGNNGPIRIVQITPNTGRVEVIVN